jgi:transglutaminase-like putative cysteine protease
MITPPFLLGVSLLFWGWQTGLLYLGVVMALALEGSRLMKWRLDLSPSDFNRISDLCTVVLLGLFIYYYASFKSARAIVVLIERLPLALLPLLIAQTYSTSEQIDISALFLIFRRKKAKEDSKQGTSINLSYPYFGICILSASAANMKTPLFYGGLFSLSAWALWSVRSRRFSAITWLSLLVFIGLAGYVGHVGLHGLQETLENRALGWFSSLTRDSGDPYRARTAIGDLGTLKLSDRILFRVTMDPSQRHLLLRESNYTIYHRSVWFARHSRFKAIEPERDGTTWKLVPARDAGKIISISMPLKGGKGMLKLPNGALEISQLPVLKMSMNQFADLRVEDGPGLINYQVLFRTGSYSANSPTEADLDIPEREKPSIEKIRQGLELASKRPREVLRILADFFHQNFAYSLELKGRKHDSTPLGEFLLHTRSGHCEYFATATVLLLRAAGLPARYATGYAVQEFSPLENRFIVRSRHAHAWALVFFDGAWHDFDTTPEVWFTQEAQRASFLEPLYDLLSWSIFKFSSWRWSERGGGISGHAGWLLIVLILFLAKRVYSRNLVKRRDKREEVKARERFRPGMDSEFYLIEERLLALGYSRHPGETLSRWIGRIEGVSRDDSTQGLQSILSLHYRYRFDPKGITSQERSALKSSAQSWLEERQSHSS